MLSDLILCTYVDGAEYFVLEWNPSYSPAHIRGHPECHRGQRLGVISALVHQVGDRGNKLFQAMTLWRILFFFDK